MEKLYKKEETRGSTSICLVIASVVDAECVKNPQQKVCCGAVDETGHFDVEE